MSVFFNDTATTEIYTLSLHDALPIYTEQYTLRALTYIAPDAARDALRWRHATLPKACARARELRLAGRSEEHTSELQSRQYLVCRLLLVKKRPLITTGSSRRPCRQLA